MRETRVSDAGGGVLQHTPHTHLVPYLARLFLPDSLTLVGNATPNLHSTSNHTRYWQHNSASNACKQDSSNTHAK